MADSASPSKAATDSTGVVGDYSLTHLRQLEAESIQIIREVIAEFKNPVMLYSIGKDSAVLVHLALKAFYPAKAAVSTVACGHDLEVPRHDRLPRELCTQRTGT